ncbi:hypothetical protein Cni_G04618 [Canna indica]|uniref:Transmembrane protein n=1 Tax=Canna indica TaxID=4628 RepID=A0AAQ3JTW1_9LILI|nr:hypothetical protein Cni_G04618 [Canna indica]
MEEKKLTTLIFFSFILYLVAVPLPGTLALRNQKMASTEVADDQVMVSRKMMMMMMNEKSVVMKRMNIELNDYPISGANSRHDPRSPGKP